MKNEIKEGKQIKIIDLSPPFNEEQGFAFILSLDPKVCEAFSADRCNAILMEDGHPLGPPESLHQYIRDFGRGAYSLWQHQLYFSSSDGSSCNKNGRRYQLAVIAPEMWESVRDRLQRQTAASDRTLMRMISTNAAQNNTIFSNFFFGYNLLQKILHRNGVPLPENLIELGSGVRPLNSLRMLAEGAKRVVATDLQSISESFPNDLINEIVNLMRLFGLSSSERLEALRIDNGDGSSHFRGLEARGGTPFEELDLPSGCTDMITSVAVLEHVMNPKAVYQQSAHVLRSGGYIAHFIDFRDHSAFHDPLRFLKLTPEEYQAIQTENRLRGIEHLNFIREAGLEPIDIDFGILPPDWEDGIETGQVAETELVKDMASFSPRITEKLRDSFADPYCGFSTKELSVVKLTVLARKP